MLAESFGGKGKVEGRKNNVRKAMLQKENDKRRMKWDNENGIGELSRK